MFPKIMSYLRLTLLLLVASIQFTFSQSTPEMDSLVLIASAMQDDTLKVDELNKLSRALLNKDNQKGLTLALDATKLANKLNYLKGEALAFKNAGNLNYRMSNYQEAFALYNQSLEIYQSIEDKKGIAILIRNLGSVFSQQGIYDEALKYYEQSLEMRKEIGDKKGIASLYNAIGLIYMEQGSELFDEALNYFEKSLETYQELSNLRGIAGAYLRIGLLHQSKADEIDNQIVKIPSNEILPDSSNIISLRNNGKKENQQALSFYEDCLVLADTIQDYFIQAQAHDALSIVYSNLENYDKAIFHSKEARKLFIDMGNKFGEANALANLGSIQKLLEKYELALTTLNKALEIANEADAPVTRKNIYFQLYTVWKAMNNKGKALGYYEDFVSVNDSLKSANLEETISKQERMLEFNRMIKERELNVQKRDLEHQAQLKQQRIYTQVSGVGFVLMLGLALLILKNLQSKKKSNRLLTDRNDRILLQNRVLQQKNEEIRLQSLKLEKQHKEIMDSITYAQRIQQAVLPQKAQLQEILTDHFILFMPRDIVSGDFYWVKQIRNVVAFAAADCTGHGVPGAFMSMLGTSFLNELVTSRSLDDTGTILDRMRNKIKKSLNQTGTSGEQKDGMDLSLMVLNMDTLKLKFSGAYNSVIIIRNGELIQLKADRQPIGIFIKEKPFTSQSFQLQEGDTMYSFSDGYTDQFGGKHASKFKINRFKELLLEISDKNMDVQKETLYQTFQQWRGEQDQIDDVLVCGVRL